MAKKDGKLTPMMQQYQRLRQSLPKDVLLFFRLGDFYELFFDDAKEAAGILNIALTKRQGTPMCGVPHHAAEGYIGKLVKAGKRGALGPSAAPGVPGVPGVVPGVGGLPDRGVDTEAMATPREFSRRSRSGAARSSSARSSSASPPRRPSVRKRRARRWSAGGGGVRRMSSTSMRRGVFYLGRASGPPLRSESR